MRIKNLVQDLTCMFSSALYKSIENPRFFSYQIASYMKQYGPRWLSKITDTVSRGLGFREIHSERAFTLFPNDIESERIKKTWFKKIIQAPNVFLTRERLKHYANPIFMGNQSFPNGLDRVLYYVNNSLPYTNSGYTNRTKFLVGSLNRNSVNVVTVSRLGYPAVIGKLRHVETGNDSKQLVPWWMPFSNESLMRYKYRRLCKLVENYGIRVLWTTTPYENAQIVSMVAKTYGIPWIYEMRGEQHKTWLSKVPVSRREIARTSEYYLKAQELENLAAENASLVIVLSEISKESLVKSGIDPSKIIVVPNGLKESEIKTHSDRVFKGANCDGKIRIGSIGALVKYEGIENLIRCLALLPENFELIIVGDGEDRTRLEKIARDIGVGSRISFIGKRPIEEMDYWYSRLHVFAVPRLDLEVCRRVTPIKPLRALATGIPVVASDLPALREVTGGYARFVIPESITDLAEGILDAAENPKEFRAPIEWLQSRSWENSTRLLKEKIAQ